MKECGKVLIAGAGPVGLSLALALSRAQIPVEVFEAGPGLNPEERASTLHPPTLEMFAAWGVAGAVLERGRKVDRLQYWERRSRTLVAEFPYHLIRDDTPYPFRLQCPQYQVTPVLLEALRAQKNARVHFNHRLLDFDDRGDHVEARVEHDGALHRFRGDWLCGADGAHSRVRRTLEIDFTGNTYEDRFLLVGSDLDFSRIFPGMGPVAYIFDPEEWVIVMALRELVRVVFRLRPGEDSEAAQKEEALRARMAEFVPEAGNWKLVMSAVYAVHQRVARHFRRGRVLLLGDAAHLNNPAGGMGMNSGIHDAHHLAQALVRALRAGDDKALDEYAEARRRYAVEHVQQGAGRNYRQLTAHDSEARNRELREVAASPERARSFLLQSAMLEERA